MKNDPKSDSTISDGKISLDIKRYSLEDLGIYRLEILSTHPKAGNKTSFRTLMTANCKFVIIVFIFYIQLKNYWPNLLKLILENVSITKL